MKNQRIALLALGTILLLTAILLGLRPGGLGGDERGTAGRGPHAPSKVPAGSRAGRSGKGGTKPLEMSEELRIFKGLLTEWKDPSVRSTDDLFGELKNAIEKLSAEEAEWFVRRWSVSEEQAGMKDNLMNWMVDRWAMEQPLEAVRLLAQRTLSKDETPFLYGLLESVVQVAMKDEPEEIFEIYLAMKTGEPGFDSDLPIEPNSLMNKFAAHDERRAWEALLTMDRTDRYHCLAGFLSGLPDSVDWRYYGEQTMRHFVEGRRSSALEDDQSNRLDSALTAIARRWAEVETDAAMDWFFASWAELKKPSGVESEAERTSLVENGAHALINSGISRDSLGRGLRATALTPQRQAELLQSLNVRIQTDVPDFLFERPIPAR